MISRRSLVLWILITVPVVVYAVLASYSLWATGLLRKVWWLGPGCWVLAWAVAKIWKTAHATPEQHGVEIPGHWTPRDQKAAEIVREFQQKVGQFTPAQLTDPAFYQSSIQALESPWPATITRERAIRSPRSPCRKCWPPCGSPSTTRNSGS